MTKMVKFEVYIPETHFEEMKNALNSIGALTVGNYDYVLSTVKVIGNWRALDNAQPYNGQIGEQMMAEELKIEFQCMESLAKEVVKTIREVHPYDEPVFRIFQMHNQFYE